MVAKGQLVAGPSALVELQRRQSHALLVDDH
jgi:hypothetical protein